MKLAYRILQITNNVTLHTPKLATTNSRAFKCFTDDLEEVKERN
jgi:hypothetical protein